MRICELRLYIGFLYLDFGMALATNCRFKELGDFLF